MSGFILAGMTGITVIVSCFLLGFSFDTLDPNTLGFLYDGAVMRLETEHLFNAERDDPKSGRIFTGLGRSFDIYRFPRYAQRVIFRSGSEDGGIILAKTRDGLSVQLSASFQYHFHRTAPAMASLAINFGTAEQARALYVMFARREIRDAVSQFEMKDLWERRANVSTAAFNAVAAKLMTKHAVVSGLQLLELSIPSEVQGAVENTTVEEQGIEETRQQQLKAMVEIRTEQLKARQDAEVTVINAQASAQKTIIDARAAALSLNVTVGGQERALKGSRDALAVSNPDLLEYLQMRAILSTKATSKLSVPQPPATG